jgi:glutamate 5-kinase
MKTLGLKRRPSNLSEIQALAAIGQVRLMSTYLKECQKHGFNAAQLLLTGDDLRSRKRFLNVQNCLEAILSMGMLPVINENDTVSVDELKFGDNDILSSMLGSLTRAELTIILTTVDGLLKPNPDGTLGERISVVRGVTDEQRAMANGTDDGNFSIGGMKSKLKAADIVNSAGDALWIASGKDAGILERIFAGEDVGTVFLPADGHRMESKKRWLATFSKAGGKIVVDDGAVGALRKSGRSLLPSGVVGAEGLFKRGDTVEIVSKAGALVAKGLSNFSAAECRKIAGLQTSELAAVLKCDVDEEVVHRNNMVLMK